jgi:hypothetical protein
MFSNSKEQLLRWTVTNLVWFEILQKRRLTEQLAEKLGCKYKELDYLFGLNYQKEVYLQKSLLIRFLQESIL